MLSTPYAASRCAEAAASRLEAFDMMNMMKRTATPDCCWLSLGALLAGCVESATAAAIPDLSAGAASGATAAEH